METAETRVPVKQFCFVCTGNLYRSKYAEACFNYLCIQNNITNIRAFSRGLRVQPTEKYEQMLPFVTAGAALFDIALKREGP